MFYVFINKFNKILDLITCIIKQRLPSLSVYCAASGPSDTAERVYLFHKLLEDFVTIMIQKKCQLEM